MGTQLNVSLIVECALVNEDLSKIETKVTFKKRKKMIKSQKKKRNNLKRTYLLKVFGFRFFSTNSCSRYGSMHTDRIVGGYILENEFEKCIKLVSKIFSSQTFFTFLRKKNNDVIFILKMSLRKTSSITCWGDKLFYVFCLIKKYKKAI